MRRRGGVAAGLVLAALVLTALSPAGPAMATEQGPAYARPGPFAAGVTTLDVGGVAVDVWYPADRRSVKGHRRASYRVTEWVPAQLSSLVATIPPGVEPAFRTNAYRDVPASKKGPFPLVTYAHGSGGYRDVSTFLTTHLASWGFVVVAPDLPESNLAVALGQPAASPGTDATTLRAAADDVRAASKHAGGLLSGTVRRGPIAAIGHSMGVHSSIQLANAGGVAAYIALDGSRASIPDDYTDRKLPKTPAVRSMYLIASPVVESDYDEAPAPKRMVLLSQATHVTAFTDICRIGEHKGGLVAIARRAGLNQLADLLGVFLQGCTLRPGALPSARLQPVTEQFVTAELRNVFGLDKHPVGLDARTARGFRGVDVKVTTGPSSSLYPRGPTSPPTFEEPSGSRAARKSATDL